MSISKIYFLFCALIVFLLVDASFATRKNNKTHNQHYVEGKESSTSGANEQTTDESRRHSDNSQSSPHKQNTREGKQLSDAELGGQTSAQGSGISTSHSQMPSNKSPHIGEREAQAKDKIAELENQKLKNELKETKQKWAMFEMYQNEQQRNIEAIMGQLAEIERKLHAKIDEKSQSKDDKLNQIAEKIETNQKILQRFIDQITEAQNGGLTIGNQWDANARENDLIIEKNELIVQHVGQMHGFVSVCAKNPIPKNGIFYFEVNDLNGFTSFAAVGLAPKELPLGERAVYFNGTNTDQQNNSYEYSLHSFASSSFPIFKNLPSLEPGDVIGCGVNLNTRNIIYTKNGKRINTPRLFVAPSADVDLFPCVTLLWTGSKIEANFGPNFKYNIDNEQQIKNKETERKNYQLLIKNFV